MEIEDDAVTGGEMSLEEAASAFVKSQESEPEGQTDDEIDEDVEADDELQESDEDESEEDEGDPDEEGQADDEDEDEPETEGGRFVAENGKVRLPDGSVATVSDLVQGNLRDKDYRQKTMGLAEEKRQFEAQSSSFKALQQQVTEQQEYMSGLLESIMPQPPDPSMVDPRSPDYDIVGYTEQKARHEAFLNHLNYIQSQREAATQQMSSETQQQRTQRASKEWETLQQVAPEFKDQAKATKLVQQVNTIAQEYGFSPQEIQEQLPYDHRMVLALRDAAKWRNLQANKPKATEKVKGRPPVQRSGKRSSPGAKQAERATNAVNRLKETGSIEDATAAYIASLNKG